MRFIVSVLMTIFFNLVSGTAIIALEYDEVPDFDCQGQFNSLLKQPTKQKLVLEREFSGGEGPVGPISAIEQFSVALGRTSLLWKQFVSVTDTGGDVHKFGCLLIIVRFQADQKNDPLVIHSDNPETTYSYLPIVLIDTFDDEDAFRQRFRSWKNSEISAFNVAVNAGAQKDKEKVVLTQASFRKLTFFSKTVKGLPPEHFRIVLNQDNIWKAPGLNIWKALGLSNAIVMICGDQPCENYDEWRNTDNASPSTNPTDTPKVIRQAETGPTPNTRIVLYDQLEKVALTLTFEKDLEQLACLLAASGSISFKNSSITCSEFQKYTNKSNLSIFLNEDKSTLSVKATPKFSPPQKITVSLPQGISGLKCTLSIKPENGNKSVRLEPVVDSSPQMFENSGPLPTFSITDSNTVKFHIIIGSDSNCGAKGRLVEVPADTELHVDLSDMPLRPQNAILHVVSLNPDVLSDNIQFGELASQKLSEQIFNAIEAAHVRVEQQRNTSLSALASATVLRVQGSDTVEELASFSGASLREQADTLFQQILLTDRTALKKGIINARGFSTALSKKIDRVKSDGADNITITLIGDTPGRDADDVLKICDIGLYNDTYETLKKMVGSSVALSLNVFTYFRPNTDEKVFQGKNALVNMSPVALSPRVLGRVNQESQPIGGLFKCNNTVPGLSVYPYVSESWRTPSDIIMRFSAALSDQVSAILFNLSE